MVHKPGEDYVLPILTPPGEALFKWSVEPLHEPDGNGPAVRRPAALISIEKPVDKSRPFRRVLQSGMREPGLLRHVKHEWSKRGQIEGLGRERFQENG